MAWLWGWERKSRAGQFACGRRARIALQVVLGLLSTMLWVGCGGSGLPIGCEVGERYPRTAKVTDPGTYVCTGEAWVLVGIEGADKNLPRLVPIAPGQRHIPRWWFGGGAG